jgi:hypothetical protein
LLLNFKRGIPQAAAKNWEGLGNDLFSGAGNFIAKTEASWIKNFKNGQQRHNKGLNNGRGDEKGKYAGSWWTC